MQPHASSPNSEPSRQRIAAIVQQYQDLLDADRLPYLEAPTFEVLIQHYADEWDLSRALSLCQCAQAQHPQTAFFAWRQAQVLSHLGEQNQALDYVSRALALDPQDLDFQYTYAEILFRQGRYQDSLEAIAQASAQKQDAQWANFRLLYCSVQEQLNQYEKALQALRNLLIEQPDCAAAYGRIQTYVETKKLDYQVLNFLENLLETLPYAPWAWFQLGELYRHFKQHRQAVQAYDYAIVVEPKFEPAYRCCLDSLFKLQDYERAYCYLEEYLLNFQTDAELLLKMGLCFEQQEQYEQACELYLKALDIQPIDSQFYFRLGYCYANLEQLPRALYYFQQAQKAQGHNPDYLLALAQTHYQLDQIEAVHQAYTLALEAAPQRSDIWINYFEFLLDEQCFEQAQTLLRQAKKHCQDPQLDLARIALLLSQDETQQEGLLRLGHSLEQNPQTPSQLFILAPDLELNPQVQVFLQNWKQARKRRKS